MSGVRWPSLRRVAVYIGVRFLAFRTPAREAFRPERRQADRQVSTLQPLRTVRNTHRFLPLRRGIGGGRLSKRRPCKVRSQRSGPSGMFGRICETDWYLYYGHLALNL